ncbi:hypothetical protein EG240_10725 [Paenimyroides tangerinum]|uniref:Uncharacterized protein n=1 Tax=Paenimyroides tangerinum TaxID=2488728 RepID=A0A3P3W437_9FLAO|nr:hypothetical protein [Paenimyroides tangerinum]RRJ89862.1 hypothetical protein EG240_10725 [Paenimyroides tangerinum]
MKTKLLTFLFLISLSHFAFGQHCAYDFASIIVVTIHEKENLNNIPNLKVTIVDSEGNNVLDRNDNEIVFWQNPEKSSTEYNNFENAKEIRYPFAKDNYVWVCGVNFSVEDYYLKIEETGNTSKYHLPYYKLIKLYEVDKFHLCGNYHNEDYHTYSGRRLYKPVEIIVQKK